MARYGLTLQAQLSAYLAISLLKLTIDGLLVSPSLQKKFLDDTIEFVIKFAEVYEHAVKT